MIDSSEIGWERGTRYRASDGISNPFEWEGTESRKRGETWQWSGGEGDEGGSVEQVARTNRYVGGNEYFTINFARFHCSNCEHFRPAGAKPQGVTINYDGVMPQSIYYAAHRMPPSNDTYVFARRRALCRRPSASLRFRCVTRGNPLPPPLPLVAEGGRCEPDVTRSPMHAGNPRWAPRVRSGFAGACTSTNWQR